jgi:hypothetical protein
LLLKRAASNILALLYWNIAGPEEIGDPLPDHLGKPIVGRDGGSVGNGRRCLMADGIGGTILVY